MRAAILVSSAGKRSLSSCIALLMHDRSQECVSNGVSIYLDTFTHCTMYRDCIGNQFWEVSQGTCLVRRFACCTIKGCDADDSVSMLVSEQEWKALNQQLRNSGFSGMELADAAQQRLGISMPSPRQLLGAFSTVLQQYDRRAQLVQELLAATDLARQREAKIDAMLSQLCRCIYCMPCLTGTVNLWVRPGKPLLMPACC